MGRTIRAVLIDCVPRLWTPFSELFDSFKNTYGSAWEATVYRQLKRLEAAGKIKMQVAPQEHGPPRKEWRRV